MSIRVVCQCGKAFKAPPQLAGKTVPCPVCKLPLTIPVPATVAPPAPAPLPASDPFGGTGGSLANLSSADPLFGLGQNPLASAGSGLSPASPSALGTYADPFTAQLASPALHSVQTAAKSPQNNQLILWLAVGGGGLALIVVVAVVIAIGLSRGAGPLASSAPVSPPSITPPTPAPPNITSPVSTPPASTPYTPVATEAKILPSDDEAKQFAQQLEQAVDGGDGEAITKAIDWDQLLRSTVDGVDAPAQFREAFLLGARQSSANSLSSAFATAVQKGARLHLLRIRTQPGQSRALFRFLLGDGSLSYLEFVLAKQTDGRVRAVDLYVFVAGELMSENIRRLYLMALRSQPGSPLPSGGGTQQELIQHLQKFQLLTTAMQNGDHPQALQIYDSLPPTLRQEKSAIIPALRASVSVDYQRHIQLAAEYRALFPDDASLDLMMIDSLILKNQYDEAMQAVDRLDKALGGDPYLNVMRAGILLAQDPVAAQKHAQSAIDAEPTLQQGYWTMVKCLLKQRDFDATARWLTTIREKFQVTIGDLRTAPEYAEFVQSQQYRDWLNAQ